MNILIFVVDKCNYKCEYCYNRFPRTLKSADLNLFSKFIKDIKVKTNRKLNISLIGGEPTLNSNIHSFIENVKELENVTVELLTNLSQPLEYYIKCLKNDVKIAASWHSNQKDKNNLDYVKKIMEIPYEYYEKNMIEVRIMFEYENWSSSDMVYNLLFNNCHSFYRHSRFCRDADYIDSCVIVRHIDNLCIRISISVVYHLT